MLAVKKLQVSGWPGPRFDFEPGQSYCAVFVKLCSLKLMFCKVTTDIIFKLALY